MAATGVRRRPYLALQVGLGLGFVLVGLLVLLALWAETGGPVPFLLGAVASVLPVPLYAALILWVDRHEKEPGWLLLAAFFWGSTVAVLAALIVNEIGQLILQALFGPLWAVRITVALWGPLVEETAKGIALLGMFYLVRDEFDNLTDGLVYGALVGLGFGVAENVLYLGRAYRAGGLGAFTGLFLIRVVLLGLMHSIWTGCTGVGLGYARESGSRWTRWVAPVAGYGAAVFLHSLWNSANVTLAAAVHDPTTQMLLVPVLFGLILLPGVVVLGGLAYLCDRRERGVLRSHLADLVQQGHLSSEELEVVASGLPKARRLWRALSGRGLAGWLALRQLYDAYGELAFARWRTAHGRPAGVPEEALLARIQELRERVRSLGLGEA